MFWGLQNRVALLNLLFLSQAQRRTKKKSELWDLCLCSSLCGLSLSHHNTFPSKKTPKHLKKVAKNKQLRSEHAHYGGTWENSPWRSAIWSDYLQLNSADASTARPHAVRWLGEDRAEIYRSWRQIGPWILPQLSFTPARAHWFRLAKSWMVREAVGMLAWQEVSNS